MPAHSGSLTPRKRPMLSASQAVGQTPAQSEAMAGACPEVLEQSPSVLGRSRRHHSDPGACVLKMGIQQRSLAAGFLQPAAAQAVPTPTQAVDGQQQQTGQSSSKPNSKRERISNSGGINIGSSSSSTTTTSSNSSSGPASFTITVDCRGDNSATALWYRMHQLEIRNKELEQQLVQRMQAAQISTTSPRGQQPVGFDQGPVQAAAAAALASPRAQAELGETETPVAMDVDAGCTAAVPKSAAQLLGAKVHAAPQPQGQVQAATAILQQQQQPQPQQQEGAVHQQRQQQSHESTQSPQVLVHSLRQQVQTLQRDLQRQKQLANMLQSDNSDLEAVLKETERQRREFAARYAFMTLDTDGDGYVSVEQVLTYDLFSCYAPSVLMAAFSVWRWDSGFPGYLCMDDFVRFVEYAEDRSTRESQRFWFSVMDADGDGRLSWADMKLLWMAVERSCSGGMLLHFEDLMNQIRDMVPKQGNPAEGFTAKELWESKLGAGVIGLLTNANNMLLQRSTAEWGRGDFPL